MRTLGIIILGISVTGIALAAGLQNPVTYGIQPITYQNDPNGGTDMVQTTITLLSLTALKNEEMSTQTQIQNLQIKLSLIQQEMTEAEKNNNQ